MIRFPFLAGDFLQQAAPVIGLWEDVEAQHRAQATDYPYDLLRAADAIIPREAAVLLVTSAQDVRHRGYTTYHRALYDLTPRSIWWAASAPSDGTWEARWWISTSIDAASISTLANQLHADYILAYDVPALSLGVEIARWPEGYLLQLNETNHAKVGLENNHSILKPSRGSSLGVFWPLQLIIGLLMIFMAGKVILLIIERTFARHFSLATERIALIWTLGSGFVSIGMMWLNALGLSLTGQVSALSILAVVSFSWLHRSQFSRLRFERVQFRIKQKLSGSTVVTSLILFLALQILFVMIMSIGQPLHYWDSWTIWGMKARTIFVEGGLSPAVYLDPSRAVTHLDYPLMLPLIESWLYAWLGTPDDRLVGSASVLFYLSLLAIVYASVRRRGLSLQWSLTITTVLASMAGFAGASGAVSADIPLAALMTVSLSYALEWLDTGSTSALVVAVLSASLLPWLKREGVVLLLALMVAAVLVCRNRRALSMAGWMIVCAVGVNAPWWILIGSQGVPNTDFVPITAAAFFNNLNRFPTIAYRVMGSGLSLDWNLLNPLLAVSLLALAVRHWRQPLRVHLTARDVLLVAPILYIALISSSYIFSSHVPYQQHVVSSIDRLIAQVMPLPILWLADRV
ncbi:MAG TPA: hypothetical protein VFF70_05150 [Anaerolineae bacterium]|nr:hypothetical protein [Anaerolineae bacterium]